MKDTYIQEMLNTYNLYNTKSKEWENYVTKANEHNTMSLETKFCHKRKPSFYSGNLVNLNEMTLNTNIKCVIISMNPAITNNDFTCSEDRQYDAIESNFEEYLRVQNDFFKEEKKKKEDRNKKIRPSKIYSYADKIVQHLYPEADITEDENIYFKYLHKYAVLVDLFPLYSKKFQLKISKKDNLEGSYVLNRLKSILSLIEDLKAEHIIVMGAKARDGLTKIIKEHRDIKLSSKHKALYFEYEDKNLYAFPFGFGISNNYLEEVASIIKNGIAA